MVFPASSGTSWDGEPVLGLIRGSDRRYDLNPPLTAITENICHS